MRVCIGGDGLKNAHQESSRQITWYLQKHIKGIGDQVFTADAVIETIPITGTGNRDLDGKLVGIFGTGNPDGTVTWVCGTAALGINVPVGDAVMYPYLPPECQH